MGRSLRPGTSFGVCSRLLTNHIHLLIFNFDFTLFGRIYRVKSIEDRSIQVV